MARRKISQTEAWSLLHRVAALEKILEEQRRSWKSDWPRGIHLCDRTYPLDGQLLSVASSISPEKCTVILDSRMEKESLVHGFSN